MLPEVYERWFAEICGRASPVETRATCATCVMMPGAADLPPDGPFDEETRCCTFQPQLQAHLVGGILRTGGETGQRLLRERIAARIGVTPFGVSPLPEYTEMWRRLIWEGRFGRSRELRCPYLEGTRCAIWRHRGVSCAAYHCKFDRGAAGQSFWASTVMTFDYVDRALSRWIVARTGMDSHAWGAFDGREEEYFLEAARLVEPLSWAEVEAIGGDELVQMAESLRRAQARRDEIPDRVRRSEGLLHQIRRGAAVRLRHPAAPNDALEVPAEVLDSLHGGPTAELGLPPELLRGLLDWQVLEPIPDPDEPVID